MKILIATDMEGITGVTAAEDISPGTAAWERFRRLFMRDVNAAVGGAFDGGATEVLVIEGHNRMRNLAIEELDERALLLTGNHKTYVMMEGVDRDVDLVFFVGYHAPAGAEGVLSHTFLGKGIVDLTLNGETCSEGRMNAMLAGTFGLGVGLLTGDTAACADASRYIPGVRTVAVKEYVDRYSAICLPPARTEVAIREAATAAVKDEAEAHPPLSAEAPYRWSASFASPSSAGRAALIPGVERVEGKTVAWSSDDYGESLQTFQVVAMLVGASFESPLLD
jgi:D-amino peptidase